MKKKIIINGQETNYSVTEDAKIFNDITGRELKGTYSTNEYHSVQLMINGKPKTFMFHRLVAEAFCENPNNYTIVDHIDRNKRNDHASNLRWVTVKENARNKNLCIERRENLKYTGVFSKNEWEPVFNHEGYMINKEGTVVNIKTRNILIPQDRHGYLRVSLAERRCSLHILVWETFNKMEVPANMFIDHIDGNKANNSLENLRLVTSSENMKNAYNNGHKGAVKVKQYSLEGEYINTYSSIKEAALAVGALEAGLKDATNRRGTCANYYWLRETDDMPIEQVIYGWIPDGYSLIKEHPTYCINQEGQVYNKRTKRHTPIKYRADGKPYVILGGLRKNIDFLFNECTLCPKNFLIAGKA